jgi:dihydropteroate synthase
VVVGTSRKSFLGRLTGPTDPHDRVGRDRRHERPGLRARSRVFRVHDVAPTVDALKVAAATLRAMAP